MGGKFELADGGTLFLDEIGELPLELQPKLLRAIQEQEIYRVGGQDKIKLDFRIISATNQNIARRVEVGTFASTTNATMAVDIQTASRGMPYRWRDELSVWRTVSMP